MTMVMMMMIIIIRTIMFL